MSSEKILGIDLGTTNSAIAIIEENGGEDPDPEIIVNGEGDRTTPSVVSFTDEGERLVGKPAKNQAVQKPDRTTESIKRHMGDEDHTVTIDGNEYSPEQVSSFILQKLKRDAEDYLDEEVTRAVITVPAYFNDKQRQATKNAGKIAGLDVERIVNEPTAASMAYGVEEDDDKTVLVFDLGGGTFDVSVLDLGMGVYEVEATNGDNDLGGDDWDEAIINWVADEFEEEHGIDLRHNRQARQRLKEAAEEAKIELSNRKETTINLPFITEGNNGPLHLEKSLTRAKFESLTADLLDRVEEPTEQALEDAGLEKDDLDEVLLVGGSTRMPQVHDKVEEMTDIEPKKTVNPDEAVAMGAAIQGGVLSGDKEDIVLLDVTPLSLGVEVKGGLFERIIEKNSAIPASEEKTFTTAEDNQTVVNIRVYQGEREMAEDNELLGDFQLTGIPPAPAGTPKIDVTFELDADGILDVSAKEKGSGRSEEITIEGGVGLSDEEVDEMREEAEKYAEEDEKRRRRIEARNEAQDLLHEADQIITGNSDQIDDDLHDSITAQMENVEMVLEDDRPDPHTIETEVDELNEMLQEIGSQVY